MTADDTLKDSRGFWLCTCDHEMIDHLPTEDVGIHPAPSPCGARPCLCQDYERVCDG